MLPSSFRAAPARPAFAEAMEEVIAQRATLDIFVQQALIHCRDRLIRVHPDNDTMTFLAAFTRNKQSS
jgi:hypothetical protein